MKTYVFGHIKPDLDSIVAAFSIAENVKQFGEENVIPAMIDDPNNETKFVFDKFHAPLPTKISLTDIAPEDRVILVDHNEIDQRLPGLDQNQIIGIYDHHKVNINFSSPIKINILPFGSSNSVAWQLFSEIRYEIPQQLAQIMLCAILSDTVGLKSSTTTQKDRDAVASLSQITNISNIEDLTLEIFRAKSNISELTPDQIIKNDYKIFDFGGKKVFISQIETVDQKTLIETRLPELISSLQSTKISESADLAFTAITDILGVNTKLLLAGTEEKSVAESAFSSTGDSNLIDIGPRMSRKKDIAPLIENSLIK